MKRGILFVLLCVAIICCMAQTDSTGIPTNKLIDSTAIGTPDGNPASKMIGATGGRIASDDGRIELIFPAGALKKDTTISIQPITNLIPGGTGKAYWFEPSGIRFLKPVQIVFHYSDEEAESCHPDLMGFGMQNRSGKWSFIEYDEWDSVSKTLKGFIQHFTGLTNMKKVFLMTYDSPLKVGARASLDIIDISREFHPFNDPTATPYVPHISAHMALGAKLEWFVNDIRNGNEDVGKINPREYIVKTEGHKLAFAEYFAPKVMPRENPVRLATSVYVYSRNKKNLVIYVLTNRIRIFDEYKVKVTHTWEYRAGMGNEVTDSATFEIWVHPKSIYLVNIKNYPPTLTKEGKAVGGCKLKIDPRDASGSLHLDDKYRHLQISKDHPPEVLFEFLPGHERVEFWFWWECRRARVNTDPEPLYNTPLNPEINFTANGKVQRFNTEDANHKYKVLVIPIR